MALPQGYSTQRGLNFSLGQRQLLSFARALVADPQILILDEVTANIDSFTEQDIQAALKLLLRDRTSLVIAHRLATIRDAEVSSCCRPGYMRRMPVRSPKWEPNRRAFPAGPAPHPPNDRPKTNGTAQKFSTRAARPTSTPLATSLWATEAMIPAPTPTISAVR